MDCKLSLNIHILNFILTNTLILSVLFSCNNALANNTSYIALSNQIARQQQMDVVANNVANANTNGFQQDSVIFRHGDVKQNSKRGNSFVYAETTYKSGEEGPLRVTNRPTDLAIGGRGFFKILTPKGPRYTLDGALLVNNQNILVNTSGYPIASQDNAAIEIPAEFEYIQFSQDGTIFVDDEEIAIVGVFDFDGGDPFIKEGNNLYKAKGQDFVPENYTIISGAIRTSNVNPTLAMTKMVELQRAQGATNSVISDISDLERSVINKVPAR